MRSLVQRPLVLSFCIVAAIVLVYGTALQNEFLTWDDDLLVTRNPIVQEFDVPAAFTSFDPELYIPLTLLTYQIEYAMVGDRPFLYHLTNLLLHIGNALLVFWIVQRLGLHRVTAFFCALLFGVHPLNTEAVVWIAARKDLLSSFLLFAALAASLQSRERYGNKWFIASLLLFLAALLSKVTAVILLPLLPFLDWWRGENVLSRWRSYVSHAVLGAVFVTIAFIGKSGELQDLSAVSTLKIWLQGIPFTLCQIVWPQMLSILYPIQDVPSLVVPSLVGIGVLLFLFRLHRRATLFSAGFFLVALLPTVVTASRAGVLTLNADRYAYIPMVGVLFLCGFFVENFTHGIVRRVAVLLTCALLVSFGWTAYRRSLVWATSEILYTTTLETYPNIPILHYNLGLVYYDDRRLALAREQIEQTLDLDPQYAEAWHALGTIALGEGNPAEALEDVQRSIELTPTWRAYVTMGNIYGALGKYREGLDAYQKAWELGPDHAGPEAERLKDLLEQLDTVSR